MSVTVLVNGTFQDSVSASDRGLAYSDGLFETIRLSNGLPEFLPEHIQRLKRACKRLSLDCDESLLVHEINLLLAHAATELQQNAVIKIIITRGVSARGYRPSRQSSPTRIIMLSPLPDYSFNQRSGVSVRVCDTRLSINPQLAGIKHLARLDNVMASNEWHDKSIVDGLMMDTVGHLVEGTMSNLFIFSDGCLKTPGLHRCGVDGVMRRLVMDRLAPSFSITVNECDLYMDDLIKADSVFITSSLIGIWQVSSIGCHHKKIDQRVIELQLALEALQGV
jgi:4-amino-4-deoxychorismate lyase